MHDFTWFGWFSDHVNHGNIHVFTAALVTLIIVLLALAYRSSLKKTEDELIPHEQVSLKNIFQVATEGLLSLMEGIMGPDAKKYFPLVGSLFVYIFINNLMGIVPGFVPATDNINTTLACGLTVLCYYTIIGIKEQGVIGYFKHMMGPVIGIAPLIFLIELVSIFVIRPASLAVRLFGNMTGDHVVLGIFSDLVPLFVPIIFMALGIFVSFIQAFVFALLTTVYIGLSVAHEDHGHAHEGAGHHH